MVNEHMTKCHSELRSGEESPGLSAPRTADERDSSSPHSGSSEHLHPPQVRCDTCRQDTRSYHVDPRLRAK